MLTEKRRGVPDNGESVGPLPTDMSKVFDCLHQPFILAKLKTCVLESDSLNLMRSYFTDRYNTVRLGDAVSSWKEVRNGCPQGSSFGPLLWNVFQNDLTYIMNSNICVYADDHQFYEINKSVSTIRKQIAGLCS